MIPRRVEAFVRAYPAVPLRRALGRGQARWAHALPRELRDRLDLDAQPVDPLRVELGGGSFPTPGYVHVDFDRRARHLEHIAPVWRLPFPDGSLREILAVHVLEHVHPAQVAATLQEWRRVLAPEGWVQAHVPNTPGIVRAFETLPVEQKWLLGAALFGLNASPDMAGPTALPLTAQPDHRMAYDADLLRHVFLEAGFAEVEDLTGRVADRHTEAWAPLVPHLSLVVRAWAGPPKDRA